jgi:hypothetical protein
MNETIDRFPDGVIRRGCELLGVTLKKVPLVEDYKWRGSDFRHLSVSFAIRCENPLGWAVVRRLAYALNSSVLELWGRQPFVFKPEGDETMLQAKKVGVIYWTLESTGTLVDPAEVAQHLELVLLSKIKEEKHWIEY